MADTPNEKKKGAAGTGAPVPMATNDDDPAVAWSRIDAVHAELRQAVAESYRQTELMHLELSRLLRKVRVIASRAPAMASAPAPRRGHPGKAERNDRLLLLFEVHAQHLRPMQAYRHVAHVFALEQAALGDAPMRPLHPSTIRSALAEARSRRARPAR